MNVHQICLLGHQTVRAVMNYSVDEAKDEAKDVWRSNRIKECATVLQGRIYRMHMGCLKFLRFCGLSLKRGQIIV